MLWRNAFIMIDRETETWWSHITGEAISGPSKGQYLEKIQSVQTTWAEWYWEHPDTSVLRKNEDVQSSHYKKYFDDPEKTGLFRSQWLVDRMPGKKLVWGASLGPHAVAATGEAFGGDRLVQVDLGETPVVLAWGNDGGVRGFVARSGSKTLQFVADDHGIKDVETSSRWDLETGKCVKGKSAGMALEAVSVTRVFWFAWSSYYPNTKVVDKP